MSIERVWIDSDYKLEGVLRLKSNSVGVILSHPHPLYGGSMSNNVISAMEKGFSDLDFTVLKFNFRGVGQSKGFYGEGEGELRDLLSAIEFLESRLHTCPRIILAGYSFGAWICARAARLKRDISDLFLVSYPFTFYDAKEVTDFRKRLYLVCGTYDDISPLNENIRVFVSLPQLEKWIKVIETDHFYLGQEDEIAGFIKRAFL